MLNFFSRIFWTVFDFLNHPEMTRGGARRQEERWRKEAVKLGATHVVERWDSEDMEGTPYYVIPPEKVEDVRKRISAGAFSVGSILVVTKDELTK